MQIVPQQYFSSSSQYFALHIGKRKIAACRGPLNHWSSGSASMILLMVTTTSSGCLSACGGSPRRVLAGSHTPRRVEQARAMDASVRTTSCVQRRASKSANYADREPRAVNVLSTTCAHRRPFLPGHCCVRARSRHPFLSPVAASSFDKR